MIRKAFQDAPRASGGHPDSDNLRKRKLPVIGELFSNS
jgi:hypothetical protein